MTSSHRRAGRRPLRAILSAFAVTAVASTGLSAATIAPSTATTTTTASSDTPPSAIITSGPAQGAVVGPEPTFTFAASVTTFQGFECRLVPGYLDRPTRARDTGWNTCTSPLTLELAPGGYTFGVRVVDAQGNYGYATYRDFSVDDTPIAEPDAGGPDVTITSGPAEGSTVTGDVTFGFTSPADDLAGYECTVDGAFVASCANPYTITGLTPGQHSFGVRGFDRDDNRGPLTVRTFTIATPGPTQACTDAQTAYDTAVAQITSLQQQIKDAKAAGQKKKVKKLKAKLAQAKADRDAAAATLEDC